MPSKKSLEAYGALAASAAAGAAVAHIGGGYVSLPRPSMSKPLLTGLGAGGGAVGGLYAAKAIDGSMQDDTTELVGVGVATALLTAVAAYATRGGGDKRMSKMGRGALVLLVAGVSAVGSSMLVPKAEAYIGSK